MTTPQTPACRETLQALSAYLDGELDATACDAIERHGSECQDCAAVLDGVRKTVGLCRQGAAVTMPDAVRERARAAVRHLLAQEPAPMPGEGSHPAAE
jgi:anti-sigma factor RsiW